MATDFVYPTSAEIQKISQDKIPRLTKDRPIFKLLPIAEKKRWKIMWEQRDNYRGLQQVRGLDGQPSRVARIGAKEYEMEPGVYGEFIAIGERELTTRRQWGSFGKPIDISDLVMEAEEQLTQRYLDRLEVIGWTLLTTGTFAVPSPNGGPILHTDTFPIQIYTATVPWTDYTNSTPLQDLRNIRLLSRGHSVNFGPASTIYINQTTLNHLLRNRNQNDLAGRRVSGLLTPLTLEEINKILVGESLPQLAIYDEGYYDDGGTFRLFIPDLTFTLVGQRPAGQSVGEYELTLNASNPDMSAGRYTVVIDSADQAKGGDGRPPRKIEVHDGHNGGPTIWYPSAVVRAYVGS